MAAALEGERERFGERGTWSKDIPLSTRGDVAGDRFVGVERSGMSRSVLAASGFLNGSSAEPEVAVEEVEASREIRWSGGVKGSSCSSEGLAGMTPDGVEKGFRGPEVTVDTESVVTMDDCDGRVASLFWKLALVGVASGGVGFGSLGPSNSTSSLSRVLAAVHPPARVAAPSGIEGMVPMLSVRLSFFLDAGFDEPKLVT